MRLSPRLEKALSDDPAYQDAMLKQDWARLAESVVRVVGSHTSEGDEEPSAPHWGGYMAIDPETDEVVGSCAFKGTPAADGTVEIAYFTYPGFEGRGYATAMASQLLALGSESPEVKRVMAHTLPMRNASTRILERIGMTLIGEVVDPDDGLVWRWETQSRGTKHVAEHADE
jgi:RimJ/RimL family protein N-acetyltransferase